MVMSVIIHNLKNIQETWKFKLMNKFFLKKNGNLVIVAVVLYCGSKNYKFLVSWYWLILKLNEVGKYLQPIKLSTE